MSDEVFPKIRTIAGDIFEIDPASVTYESSTESVSAWDSLQHVNFVLALEDAFKITFTPEEVEAIRSIGDAVTSVNAKLAM